MERAGGGGSQCDARRFFSPTSPRHGFALVSPSHPLPPSTHPPPQTDSAKQNLHDMAEKAKQTASDAAEKVKDAAGYAKEQTQDKATELRAGAEKESAKGRQEVRKQM